MDIKIKESLMDQLVHKGACVEHFVKLVNDYLFYCDQEMKMQRNIKKRGITYEAVSVAGKTYEKDNPAVKSAVMFNKQKLAILKELELKTDNVQSDNEDEL